jgi:hypothetical protein
MYRDKVVYLGQQRCRMCGSFHTLATSAVTQTPGGMSQQEQHIDGTIDTQVVQNRVDPCLICREPGVIYLFQKVHPVGEDAVRACRGH